MNRLLPAAFVLLSAAVFAVAQQSANKQNVRPHSATEAPAQVTEVNKDPVQYAWEFTQPEFLINHILIEHDANGRGRITFSNRNDETPVVEPFELSSVAAARISSLWSALNFLESKENYQSDRQYPHLGTMRLKMERDGVKRTSEFNWTNHPVATQLVAEYRRASDQALVVFDISVARESHPLATPKLLDRVELLLTRNGLSDPKQLVPLLKDISTDEHLPLISRNHATRLLKKIEK